MPPKPPCFKTCGNVKHAHVRLFLAQGAGHFLNAFVPRIGNRVDGVTKTNHHFFTFDAGTDVGFGFVRIGVALLNFKSDFVGTAMLWTAKSPDTASNG